MRVIWSAVLLLGPDSNLATPTSDCSPTSSQSGPVPLFGSGLPTPVVLPARAPGAYVASRSPPAAPDPRTRKYENSKERRNEREKASSHYDEKRLNCIEYYNLHTTTTQIHVPAKTDGLSKKICNFHNVLLAVRTSIIGHGPNLAQNSESVGRLL